jgi:hypothetical protein
MKLFKIILFVSVVLIMNAPINAQYLQSQPDTGKALDNKTVIMAAGIQFKASQWKQFWWGKHWREEWIKPVGFPVFDIDTTAGGLTPLKKGGGHQTKSLRLMSKGGKEYILRTIDKDLELLIPEEFKGSFINDIVNDQISTAHPYGPLAIASLAASIGSLHTNPVIVFVPDDVRLGDYKNDFANKLCLFEERPSGDGWEKDALTNYADDMVNSEKLFLKLDADNDKEVNQATFLKIRLLDMVINDWDRHPDQWVWAAYKNNGKTSYVPFARDRDQAFSKTDGVYIYFLSRPWLLRSVRNMDAKINDVIGVNLAAVSLDKEFTNELTKEEWINTIKTFQTSLTDAEINKALLQMPKPIYDMSGSFLQKRLTQRRDNMLAYGIKYYNIINRKVTVAGSDKQEIFTINNIDKNTTEIIVQQSSKKNGANDTIFFRRFTHDITKEINLYGLGDNDAFVYKGVKRNKILVRVIGGDGQDVYADNTNGIGSGKKSKIYETDISAIKSTKAYRGYSGVDSTYTTYNRKAFKYDWWKPMTAPGYNPDDGLTLTLGLSYKKQGWHKSPFAWQQTFNASIATATGSISFMYKGVFKQVLRKWDLLVDANFKAPKYVLNFYGYGNETKLNNADNSFFRVRSSGFFVNPALSRSWKKATLTGGLVFQSVKIQSTSNKFISEPNSLPDSSIFSTKYFGGTNVAFTVGNIMDKINPHSGIGYNIQAGYFINLKQTSRDYLNLQSDVKFYLPIIKGLTLAHRTGFATNFGDYEFYQANTVGGLDKIRGYWRTRFTGQTSFYQNTELRLQLIELRGYVFRGLLGAYGFFDDGRVWVKKDHSSTFHIGYGGGIYFMPYNKVALNISYGISKEANVFTVKTGFLF